MNATQLQPLNDELQTRQRLLEAAGEVFAEQGYKNATVREICRRADANIAAVNYHFGDKARLYSQVLRHVLGEAMAKYPPNLGVTDGSTPEQKLFAYVRSYLFRILDEGRHALLGKLISREMIEPTHALDECINETIRPMAQLLGGIVREIVGGELSQEDVFRCARSVVGQIVFYHHCRPALKKIFPDFRSGTEEIEALARHITEFSLSGIRAIAAARHCKGEEAV